MRVTIHTDEERDDPVSPRQLGDALNALVDSLGADRVRLDLDGDPDDLTDLQSVLTG